MSRSSFIQAVTPVFFPAAGYRNNSSGALNNVGSNGNYWSAVPNSSNNAWNLNFNSGNVNPQNNNNRANGHSVRPVQHLLFLSNRSKGTEDSNKIRIF